MYCSVKLRLNRLFMGTRCGEYVLTIIPIRSVPKIANDPACNLESLTN